MDSIPDDINVVEPVFNKLKINHSNHKTKDLSFRRKQLENLLKGHNQLKQKFDGALQKDLGYNQFLSGFLSHSITNNQIQHTLHNLQNWSQQISIDTPIAMGIAKTYTRPEPLGVVLVMPAWNYPIYTGLPVAAIAIAAGNSVLFKPSEMAPATSKVLKQLFDKYLDNDYYVALEGKVQVAKKLSNLPFDLIFFTGSTTTGRFIAEAAAKNLVPCVLELGGKCPVIVDESANLDSAAMRILFGKNSNCGQTCVGADHVFAHKTIKKQLLQKLIQKSKQFYGSKPLKSNADMGKIISPHHVQRLQNYLNQNHGGKIVWGGAVSIENQFIQPTIVDSPRLDSLLMTEEIFGPILPVLQYQDLEDLIKLLNSRPKPLVVYAFTENSQTKEKLKNFTTSGAFVVNDLVLHMLNSNLPFGGVGKSGYGRYHGKLGFDACSNLKSIMQSKCLDIYPLSTRYPPYTASTQSTIKFLLGVGKMTFSELYRKIAFLIVAGLLGGAYKYYKPRL